MLQHTCFSKATFPLKVVYKLWYTYTLNSIYAKTKHSFLAPIFIKLTYVQRHYVQNSYVTLHQNWENVQFGYKFSHVPI